MIFSREMIHNLCSPHDKPWLISSHKSIEESKRRREAVIGSWLKEIPYPGNESSKQEKTNWHRKICDKHHDEYLARLDASVLEEPPQAYEVIREVLSKNAPSSLLVSIKISRSDLERINIENEKDAAQFSSNLAKNGQFGYEGERNWTTYRNWLLETQTETNILTLGSIECLPEDVLVEKCIEFCCKLGIERFFDGISEDEPSMDKTKWCYYGLFEKIQENMYYPLLDHRSPSHTGNATRNRIGISVILKTKLCATAKDIAEHEFQSSLRALKRKYLKTKSPKTYLIFPFIKEKEEPHETIFDNDCFSLSKRYIVLWLPLEFIEYESRINAHLLWGEGENSSIRERLFAEDNAETGNIKVEMIAREFHAIQLGLNSSGQKMTWKEKMCATLALTKAIASDTWWIQDNDYPDRTAKLIKDLATYWREHLLMKDDKILGIGVEENAVDSGIDVSNARMGLYLYLKLFERNLKNSNCSTDIQFKWKPKTNASMRNRSGIKRRRTSNE